jgi:hypothetical protein
VTRDPFDEDPHYLLAPRDVARHVRKDHSIGEEAAMGWLRQRGLRATNVGDDKLDVAFARVNLSILGIDHSEFSREETWAAFMHHLIHDILDGDALVFDRAGTSYR